MNPSIIDPENVPAPFTAEVALAQPDWTRINRMMNTLDTMLTHIHGLAIYIWPEDPQTRADWAMNHDPTDPGVSMTFVVATIDGTDGNFCVVFRCISEEARVGLRQCLINRLGFPPPTNDGEGDRYDLWELE